ncbi:carbohydrate ABC transporter permease [Lachnospiraceae bacterium 54-11]|jgi:multiple sugar transport system permease protein|nr:carbohydrate ABC transporter permease [Lachnospiraceae bacterium]MCI9326156.1 carbohydrate ABC transporter permease [Lachnospiraceae bacterium]
MNKYVIKRGIFSSLKTITLLLLALIILFPFWQLIVSSLLETNAIISYPPKFWPKGGSVNNYIEVLTMQGGAYMRWMANSLLVSGANTILVILVAAMAGYAFAKRKFPGRSVLLNIVIATQIIPSVTTLIPLFLIVSKLGWVNTYKSLIFPGVANAFGVYMMTQFMKDIPDSLLEAATIDGCGEYGKFFKIVMPITVPQLSLLAIFNFTNQWGSLTWPLITVNETMMKTLPLGIASMKDLNGTLTGTIMAASMISFIPLLIAFIFASDKFIEGMTLGAVKG